MERPVWWTDMYPQYSYYTLIIFVERDILSFLKPKPYLISSALNYSIGRGEGNVLAGNQPTITGSRVDCPVM